MEKISTSGGMFFSKSPTIVLAYSNDQLLGVYINEILMEAHDLSSVLALLGIHGKSVLVADYGSDSNTLPKTAKALLSKKYETLDF